MPVSVTCQSCFKTLKAPDHLIGKRVKCPACSAPLEVTDGFGGGGFAADPYAAGGGADQGGGAAPPGARRTEWGSFSFGVFIVTITWLALAGLAAVLILIAKLAESAVMIDILGYVDIVAVAALGVGLWFCAKIPAESGQRGMVKAAFLFLGPAAVIVVLHKILGLASFFKSAELMPIFGGAFIAAKFSITAGNLLFAISLSGVANSLKAPPLAKSAFAFLLFALAVNPVFSLYQGVYGAFGGGPRLPGGLEMPTFGQRGGSGFDSPPGTQQSGVFGQMKGFPTGPGPGIPTMPTMPSMPRMAGMGGMTSLAGLPSPMGVVGTVDQIVVDVLLVSLIGWLAYLLWTMRGLVMQTQRTHEM